MKEDNSNYIEVIGEGSYNEEIDKYIADLTLEVRATHHQKAIEDMNVLKDKVINKMIDSGLDEKEIIDNGMEIYRPWYSRKKTGKNVWYKLGIKTDKIHALSKMVNDIEELFDEKRFIYHYDMRQPEFKPEENGVENAQKEAFQEAREKAQNLAREAELQLGKVIQIEELSKAKRNSGAYGDYDWGGDSARFAPAGGGDLMAGALSEEMPADNVNIEKPKRTIWLRYRIRFAV